DVELYQVVVRLGEPRVELARALLLLLDRRRYRRQRFAACHARHVTGPRSPRGYRPSSGREEVVGLEPAGPLLAEGVVLDDAVVGLVLRYTVVGLLIDAHAPAGDGLGDARLLVLDRHPEPAAVGVDGL